jgi:1-phosphofructokinase
MIYTLTLNPALDYFVEAKTFNKVETNRAINEHYLPGGKGILASIMLSNLECKNIAFGFMGGHTGDIIKDELSKYSHINQAFTEIDEATRTNIKIWDNGMTEFNVEGPIIKQQDFIRLLSELDQLTENDLLIIAGSIPKGISPAIYNTICEACRMKGTPFIIDTTGDKLKNTLMYNPVLIKPNQEEIEELVGKKLNSSKEIVKAGKELLKMGAKNVMITLGGEGAYLITESEVFSAKVPDITVVNTVGAGDSSVAGFSYAYMLDLPLEECFKYAMACGSATASSPFIGTIDKVENTINKVLIRKHR